MSVTKKLKKGFDIRLKGRPANKISGEIRSQEYCVKPGDFPGVTPKLNVKAGDSVKAGSALFHDKTRPEIIFSSPVSGTVKAINRGEQRRILEIVITVSGDEFVDFGKSDPEKLKREEIRNKLLSSGLWPVIRQRPYHIIANPVKTPKSIFISGFDTSPLAPDMDFVTGNIEAASFQTGIKALAKLTDGKLNLVLNGEGYRNGILQNVSGVERHYISGPHPAGNVGIQIHHIDPLNKGEVVWYVNLQDVAVIGNLFSEGIYRNERLIALAGSEVTDPQYFRVRSGVAIKDLVAGKVSSEKLRLISGNVLTGSNAGLNGYLGFYDNMVTVIPEGDYFEFFGWAKPGLNKYSFFRTFLSSVLGKKEYRLDTNLHGGHRAFVLTGQYEKVVPMDIYPMQLLKAILAEDIDTWRTWEYMR
jgi:Na+-transporting NADH:ubiquinone oxidoreductase subunit A